MAANHPRAWRRWFQGAIFARHVFEELEGARGEGTLLRAPQASDGVDRRGANALVGVLAQQRLDAPRGGVAAAGAGRDEGDARDGPGAALHGELVARSRVVEEVFEEGQRRRRRRERDVPEHPLFESQLARAARVEHARQQRRATGSTASGSFLGRSKTVNPGTREMLLRAGSIDILSEQGEARGGDSPWEPAGTAHRPRHRGRRSRGSGRAYRATSRDDTATPLTAHGVTCELRLHGGTDAEPRRVLTPAGSLVRGKGE